MASRVQEAHAEQTFGELVVLNGRHAGAKRPLAGPLTLIGRASGCDIRLQMEGVAGRHCVLARTAEGLVLRDLGSKTGTIVNGDRAQSATDAGATEE